MKKKTLFSLLTSSLIALGGLASCVGEVTTASPSVVSASVNGDGDLILTWSDGSTTNAGKVKGDKGDTGETGAQGEKGDKGDAGAAGKDGVAGKDGTDGKDGSTWHNGKGLPASEIGKLGDYYLDALTGNVYYLTDDGWTYLIDLKQQYKKVDSSYYVDSYDEFLDAYSDAADGETIVLDSDMLFEETLCLHEDKNVTIDLAGHTITNNTDIWNNETQFYSLFELGVGSFTFDDSVGTGKIKSKENDAYAIYVLANAKLTINGGEFVGNAHSVYAAYGTVDIYGGKFSIQQVSGIVGKPYDFVLNCLDSYYKEGKAKITVYGGTYERFDPANNKSEGDNTNLIPTECISTKETKDGVDYYTVTGSYTADSYDSLVAAYKGAGDGSTIKLTSNVDFDKPMQFNLYKKVTIDLAGYTVSNTNDIWNEKTGDYSLFEIDRGEVIMNDSVGNGKLIAKENDEYAILVGTLSDKNAKLTINAGEYIGNISSVYVIQGVVDIYGGKYSIRQTDTGADPYKYTLNHLDECYKAGTAKITVYGGSYCKFDPSNTLCEVVNGKGVNLLADGYKSTKGDDEYYTVAKSE